MVKRDVQLIVKHNDSPSDIIQSDAPSTQSRAPSHLIGLGSARGDSELLSRKSAWTAAYCKVGKNINKLQINGSSVLLFIKQNGQHQLDTVSVLHK